VFIGREKELEQLNEILDQKTASLVVCKGRRRIGKSRLVEEFGQKVKQFYDFQGLAPHAGARSSDQLKNFAEQLGRHFNLPEIIPPKTWTEAFSLLARYTLKGRVVILLDEISWMASTDKTFAGKLKIAWDTLFKKNPLLVLVLCGSVSSWIDKNILKNSAFVGRISLKMTLQELPLMVCNKFWGQNGGKISPFEKFKILSLTGGVPRYLEEVKPKLTAEENIRQLCFVPSGLLFSEFEDIFSSTFSKRAKIYEAIVSTLVTGKKGFVEICQALKRHPHGAMSAYLDDLVESGFLSLDVVYKIGGKITGLKHYRLKDNYLRFYLKYIQPVKSQIKSGLYEVKSLESLPAWNTIMGFQFENLVLNQLFPLCHHLKIPLSSLESASPYFQKKTQRKKACQIDLLIQTKHTLYVCEIKFRKIIEAEVITEVQEKISKLKIPRNFSVRPVLIYEGERSSSLKEDDYFSAQIAFGDLLEG
jgi:uncharacterized protein